MVDEVVGLYRIIPLKTFRTTAGVVFENVNLDFLPRIDAVDRVIHVSDAVSPGAVGDVVRPWYMHPHQDDNLVVLHGTRYVEIFTPDHGRVEQFVVTADSIEKNGEVVFSGAAMLVWPCKVFHRIRSGHEGSCAINFAVHYDGFNMDTNFNIYDLNTETGRFHTIRRGADDQY